MEGGTEEAWNQKGIVRTNFLIRGYKYNIVNKGWILFNSKPEMAKFA